MLRFALAAVVLVAVFFGLKFMMGASGTEPAGNAAGKREIISTIAVGERFDLADHIPDQGIVLVEFTADW